MNFCCDYLAGFAQLSAGDGRCYPRRLPAQKKQTCRRAPPKKPARAHPALAPQGLRPQAVPSFFAAKSTGDGGTSAQADPRAGAGWAVVLHWVCRYPAGPVLGGAACCRPGMDWAAARRKPCKEQPPFLRPGRPCAVLKNHSVCAAAFCGRPPGGLPERKRL